MKAILKVSRKLFALACSELVETNNSPRQMIMRFFGALGDEDVDLLSNMLELYGNERVQKWVHNIRERAIADTAMRTSTSIKISFG